MTGVLLKDHRELEVTLHTVLAAVAGGGDLAAPKKKKRRRVWKLSFIEVKDQN